MQTELDMVAEKGGGGTRDRKANRNPYWWSGSKRTFKFSVICFNFFKELIFMYYLSNLDDTKNV